MAEITVTIKKLGIAGRNFKRTDLLGVFDSLQEANDAIADGSIVPDSDSVNVKSNVQIDKAGGPFTYVWSHSLSAFVSLGHGDGSGMLANAYIRLAGTDELIEFEQMQPGNPTYCLLNLDVDWAASIKIPLIDTPENGQRIKLIENGQNAIQINMGSGNYGLYFTDGSISAGVNVFSEVVANDELTFSYNATSKTLLYYINGANPKSMSLTNRTNNANGKVKIAAPTGSDRLKGGVNDLVIWDHTLSSNDTAEIAAGVPLIDRTAYSSVVSHLPMGEDVYPHVGDIKNNLIDGVLVNGSPDDFVAIQ